MNAADHEKRVVLPQWLPFSVAAQQRETLAFGSRVTRAIDFTSALPNFTKSLQEFRVSPSPFVGAELMGRAKVMEESEACAELAEYVLAQRGLGPVVHRQANIILGRSSNDLGGDERARLRRSKKHLGEFPRDAIAWIEQARLYTILGVSEKAKNAVLAAIQIAPSDRFIVRSAIRFFAHLGEWDDAFRVGYNAYYLNRDPLIFGPLLSAATRVKKLPSKTKTIVENALTSVDTFLHSETLEAFGTLEVIAGADQRSKRYFKKAWTDPTKSVVGHSQWILREHLPTLASDQQINFWESKEAVSWLRFSMLDFSKAVEDTTEWSLEEPYSRAPHILGSISACIEDDFTRAEEIAKIGLLSNPKDEILINNLAFAQLRNGKVQAGEKTFSPLIPKLSDKSEVALLATHGLLKMSQGLLEEGVILYNQAITRAIDTKDRRLAVRATLNLIISAIDTAKTVDSSLLKSAQLGIREVQDPACFGAASAISRRLAKANLSESSELVKAAKEFTENVEKDRNQFRSSISARLLHASPKKI